MRRLARRGLLAGVGATMGLTVASCADDKALGFDPEALERGAKALREINASPWAKKVDPRWICCCWRCHTCS